MLAVGSYCFFSHFDAVKLGIIFVCGTTFARKFIPLKPKKCNNPLLKEINYLYLQAQTRNNTISTSLIKNFTP
jgi:hypothetical protein